MQHKVVDLRMPRNDWQSEMRKGVVEMCVLSALSDGAMYGYKITQVLNAFETLRMRDSTLYLILARLERDNLISVQKVASDKGPMRKYFSLTQVGRERLLNMTLFWGAYSKDATQFLKGAWKNDRS